MGFCINCLFQGDNIVDEQGNGKVFCMVKRKWLPENESCENFTDYADLSKEIRSQYAFEIRDIKNAHGKMGWAIKQNWKAMIIAFIIAFVTFMATIKFFDRYIF
jgi:hypothetical protein